MGRIKSILSFRANSPIVSLGSFFNKIPMQKVKMKAKAMMISKFLTLPGL